MPFVAILVEIMLTFVEKSVILYEDFSEQLRIRLTIATPMELHLSPDLVKLMRCLREVLHQLQPEQRLTHVLRKRCQRQAQSEAGTIRGRQRQASPYQRGVGVQGSDKPLWTTYPSGSSIGKHF